jgi:hypothetical protein
MKKLLILVSCLWVTHGALAEQPCKVKIPSKGLGECSAGTMQHMVLMGGANVDGTTVTGDVRVLGNLNAKNFTVEQSLRVKGNTNLTSSKIMGEMNLSGDLKAKETSMGGGTVNGSVFLSQSAVTSDFDIKGNLHAVKTKFEGEVIVAGVKIYLENSTIGSLVIEPTNANTVQVVKLEKGSHVGDVLFTAGDGHVIVAKDASVGGVSGGSIVK